MHRTKPRRCACGCSHSSASRRQSPTSSSTWRATCRGFGPRRLRSAPRVVDFGLNWTATTVDAQGVAVQRYAVELRRIAGRLDEVDAPPLLEPSRRAYATSFGVRVVLGGAATGDPGERPGGRGPGRAPDGAGRRGPAGHVPGTARGDHRLQRTGEADQRARHRAGTRAAAARARALAVLDSPACAHASASSPSWRFSPRAAGTTSPSASSSRAGR